MGRHKQTNTQHTNTMSKINVTGKWKLDAKVSDELEPILKLVGKSFLQRKVMNNIKSVVQDLEQTGDTLNVTMITSVKTVKEVVEINGSEVEKTMEGKEAKVKAFYSDDGQKIIVEVRRVNDDGKPAVRTTTRHLEEDGKVMIVTQHYN